MAAPSTRCRCPASLGRAAIQALRFRPVVSQTPHFALHRADVSDLVPMLSTEVAPGRAGFVDNQSAPGLGIMLPKRLARRAVTRNLIRRQVREAARRWSLTEGLWLFRLRTAFDSRQFPSAASAVLRVQVRSELDDLMRRSTHRAPRS